MALPLPNNRHEISHNTFLLKNLCILENTIGLMIHSTMAYLNRLMDISSILSYRSDLLNGISGKPDHDITLEEQCTEALLKMAIVAKGNKANCIYVAS